jgi:CubicO group peptidase (beta-lactamase class C family)
LPVRLPRLLPLAVFAHAALHAALPARRLTAQAAPGVAPAAAARIRQVESGLLPNVPVAGMGGWRLADRMRFHRVPGVSVAVIRDYRVAWVKAYGLADTTTRAPVTPATLFSAGSISKLATAVLAMRLARSGAVDLDAPVNTLLKRWQLGETERTRATPVTLRLLLAHRGGTSQSSYFGFVPGRTPGPNPYPSVVDVLNGAPNAETRRVVVNQPVGAGFSYSGGGYLVAQLALTDAAGYAPDRFAALAADSLFAPLGMRDATFAQPLPDRLAPGAAWAYSENGWFQGMPYVYPQQAPAGLYATAADLARLVIEVQQAARGRGRLLDSASARAMLTPQADVSTGSYREQIGLGPFLLQRADLAAAGAGDSTRYFEHTGVNAGFLAYAVGSVDGGNGVVVMMNNDGGAAELGKEIRRAVARAYGWPGFLLDPVTPARLAAAARARAEADVVGRYRRGPDAVVTFRHVGRGRAARLEEVIAEGVTVGAPIPCVLVGRDSVGFTDFPGTGVLVRDAAGRVTGVRMPYTERPLPRLAPGDLTPGELLRAGRLAEAEAAYRALALGESQITYLAYELLNRRPFRPATLPAARVLLGVAQGQYPRSAAVQARWGEYHLRTGDTTRARAAYGAALAIDSTDAGVRAALAGLTRPGGR